MQGDTASGAGRQRDSLSPLDRAIKREKNKQIKASREQVCHSFFFSNGKDQGPRAVAGGMEKKTKNKGKKRKKKKMGA